MPLPSMPQKLPSCVSTKPTTWCARWACLQSAMSSDTLEAERHKNKTFAVAFQGKTVFPCLHSHSSDSSDTLCNRGHFGMSHSHQGACTLLRSGITQQLSYSIASLTVTLICPPNQPHALSLYKSSTSKEEIWASYIYPTTHQGHVLLHSQPSAHHR